ncbi:MAG: putative sulfate exporter family transporter [Thermoflavifilum sp.]|nr:putative sulfate exporter family transporter [Thermoflavifilum sp.]MCL6514102.1 YeiH family protein [Alicyclobacillus sp.]
MSDVSREHAPPEKVKGWSEDGWSVFLGLLLVVAAWAAYLFHMPLDFFQHAVPKSWPQTPLGVHFAKQWPAYIGVWLVLLVLTGLAAQRLGASARRYVVGFTILFMVSLVVLVLGSQQTLKTYGLEYPFWALIIGVIGGNVFRLPHWLRAASDRTELFIKTSIVLLGANLPFSIIARSGPKGFLEALLIVAVGFAVSQWLGRRMKIEDRYLAVLGAGASVCGVSAAIAVGNTVRAKHRQVGYVVSLVVVYGLVLIFLLPALVRLLHLSNVVGGAWIGGSELADASGAAAAAMLGDDAVKAFSLVKLSRDVLISIVCLIFGTVSAVLWDARDGDPSASRPQASVLRRIWERFPKFVLAFIVASLLSTWWQAALGNDFATNFTANLNALRTWLFTLTFLGVGLNTRFSDLRDVGGRAVAVFTLTVVVNVILGALLAIWFFG